jgi:hypothetical protein
VASGWQEVAQRGGDIYLLFAQSLNQCPPVIFRADRKDDDFSRDFGDAAFPRSVTRGIDLRFPNPHEYDACVTVT